MPKTSGVTELKHTGYEIFIAALTVLSIANLVLSALIRNDAMTTVVLTINAVLSAVLFVDFLYRFATAESRRTYFFRDWGWADLLASIPLTQVKVLRVFRLIRVWRILRVLGLRYVGRTLVRSRAGSALLLLLLVAILMLEFGSLLMLHLEDGAPDANIETAGDAIWYVLVTMSTVGYGDQYPVTNGGRILGSVIIVVGVGIFGTLTGFLANSFLSGPEGAAGEVGPGAASGADQSGADGAGDAGPSAASTPAAGTPAAGGPAGAGSPPGAPGSGVADEGTRADVLRQQLQGLRAQHLAAIERLDQLLR